MSEDIGEMWDDYKRDRQKKKQENEKSSIELLKSQGIDFIKMKGACHYKVGEYDYWASTGKFYNQKTGEKGRGVKNLIKTIR